MWKRAFISFPVLLLLCGAVLLLTSYNFSSKIHGDETGLSVHFRRSRNSIPWSRCAKQLSLATKMGAHDSRFVVCPSSENQLTESLLNKIKAGFEQYHCGRFPSHVTVDSRECSKETTLSPTTRMVLVISVEQHPINYMCTEMFSGGYASQPNLNIAYLASTLSKDNNVNYTGICNDVSLPTSHFIHPIIHAFMSWKHTAKSTSTFNSRALTLTVKFNESDKDFLSDVAYTVVDIVNGVGVISKDFHTTSYGWMFNRGNTINFMFHQAVSFMFIASIALTGVARLMLLPWPPKRNLLLYAFPLGGAVLLSLDPKAHIILWLLCCVIEPPFLYLLGVVMSCMSLSLMIFVNCNYCVIFSGLIAIQALFSNPMLVRLKLSMPFGLGYSLAVLYVFYTVLNDSETHINTTNFFTTTCSFLFGSLLVFGYSYPPRR